MHGTWLDFFVLPLIGATIGALTNRIAVHMLFRPHRAVRLGAWRLPLTPGLIPVQRHAIARNIAAVFEANLLSGVDIHAIVAGAAVRQALDAKLDEFLADFGWFARLLVRFKPRVLDKLIEAIKEVSQAAIADGGTLNIAQRLEARINAMDLEQLEQLVLSFSRQQLRHITWFGGLIGAIIGLVQAVASAVF